MKKKVIAFGIIVGSLLHAQTENWVYHYDGPGRVRDACRCITYGGDGNIYAAGRFGDSLYWPNDFCNLGIISLTDSGTARWIYEYQGPGPLQDEAYSIVYGPDSAIYVSGFRDGGVPTMMDFLVMSLTDSGTVNWMYIYEGFNHDDWAYEIAFDPEGNLYVAGTSSDSVWGFYDIIVISLTSKGDERWIYRYDGPANYYDDAQSITYGADGNLYVAGSSCPTTDINSRELTVISLTDSGTVNWIYRYQNPNRYCDWASDIVYGLDGNLYVSGYTAPVPDQWAADFAVFSLTTSGVENWVYLYSAPESSDDGAFSLVYGPDNNVYAAGYTSDSGWINADMTIMSLSTAGAQNWMYTYAGAGGLHDAILDQSLVYGLDGNLYACGYCYDNITFTDMKVICLTTSGTEKWVYTYNGPWSIAEDRAEGLCFGTDGNIYVGGSSYNMDMGESYFTVISIGTGYNVNEQSRIRPVSQQCSAPSFFRDKISLTFTHPSHHATQVVLYNVLGQQVFSKTFPNTPQSLCVMDYKLASLPQGIYFLAVSSGEIVFSSLKITKY